MENEAAALRRNVVALSAAPEDKTAELTEISHAIVEREQRLVNNVAQQDLLWDKLSSLIEQRLQTLSALNDDVTEKQQQLSSLSRKLADLEANSCEQQSLSVTVDAKVCKEIRLSTTGLPLPWTNLAPSRAHTPPATQPVWVQACNGTPGRLP